MIETFVVALYFVTFFALATWRPGTVLGAAISLHAMEQWAQANSMFFSVHTQYINYAFGLLVIWALLFTILKYGNPFRRMPAVAVVIYLMLALAYCSYFWSIDPLSTRFVFEAFIPYLGTYIVLMPLVFVSRNDLRQGLMASLIVGGVVLLMLFFGTFVGVRSVEFQTAVFDRWGKRIESGNPLAIATFAGSMMILAASLRFKGASRALELARWVILPMGVIVTIQSESRGQLFAALAAIMIAVPISMGQLRFQHVMAAILTLLVVAVVVPVALQNFTAAEGRWDAAQQFREFRETRVDLSSKVLSNWLFHGSPINFFVGMGSSSSVQVIQMYPHVVAVEVLAEMGIVGGLLGFLAVMLCFKSCIMLIRATRNSPIDRGDVAALVGLFVFEFLLSFKQGSFLGSQMLMAVCIILALNERIWADLWKRYRQQQRGPAGPRPRSFPDPRANPAPQPVGA